MTTTRAATRTFERQGHGHFQPFRTPGTLIQQQQQKQQKDPQIKTQNKPIRHPVLLMSLFACFFCLGYSVCWGIIWLLLLAVQIDGEMCTQLAGQMPCNLKWPFVQSICRFSSWLRSALCFWTLSMGWCQPLSSFGNNYSNEFMDSGAWLHGYIGCEARCFDAWDSLDSFWEGRLNMLQPGNLSTSFAVIFSGCMWVLQCPAWFIFHHCYFVASSLQIFGKHVLATW